MDGATVFLRAANDQQAAVLAGCKSVAPIFETGQEGNNAFYVSQHYPRSVDSLVQGRVALEPAALHRLTDRILKTLEDLRDKHARAHGNLKPTNIFLDGKGVASATVVLGDLSIREEGTNQGTDCYALGAVLYQLIRGRTVRHFDWPMVHGPEWDKLGPAADGWREFCNVLMSPETSANPDALGTARQAFKNMRRLAAAGRRHANAADAAAASEGVRRPAPPNKGWLAGIGTAIVAGVSAVIVAVQPADSKAKTYLRTLPMVGVYAARFFPLPTPTPAPTPDISKEIAQETVAPTATPEMATPEPTPVTPPPTPTAPPTPTPVATPTYIGYASVLDRFKSHVDSPEMVDAPENLNGYLNSLREDIKFSDVAGDAKVQAFAKKLPAQIPATNSVPDLPGNLWVKENAGREGGVQFVKYHLNGAPGIQMQFNRVNLPNNGPAFYLSATTVPVKLGVLLARSVEANGGPLSGASSARGPVTWQMVGGNYGRRAVWIVPDSINGELYKVSNETPPTDDDPMNGLSGRDAARLAQAAGCTLPTLAQWDAVLASPSGQAWENAWKADAKVRGSAWSRFARDAQARSVANTGTKLPNDQCFGDKLNLEPVGDGNDANLFFEPVGQRVIGSYAQLIGNVGQYVVDNASNPTKFYFAGGSAESAPAVFQNLSAPPLASPFIAVADAGLRLAAGAKGNGSDKNPALDKLKVDLDAEIARVQNLP